MIEKGMSDLRIFNMPDGLRKTFKVACAEQDISMNQKLISLIEEWLKSIGKLK